MAYAINSKRIAKNTMMLYIRLGITMIISFFTARVTLEQLGIDDYGLNNLVGSIVSLFSFINGSMGTAVQRFYNIEIGKKNEEGLGRVFGVGLYLHIWVALITLVLAEIFAIFFLNKLNIPADRLFAAQTVFQISIISLGINIINVPFAALLRAREMFSQTAIIEIIQSFLRLGVLYALVHINADKLITLSLLNFAISALYFLSIFILAWRFKETHHRPCRDKDLIKQMLTFISMLLVTVLASLLKTKGIVLLVNLFFGLAINAAYAVAAQVSNMVNSFVANFKQSVVPQMVSAYGSGDVKTMCNLINTGTKITFILLLMLSLPVMFEAQWILDIWLKNPPENAAKLVVLVLVNINISSFSYFHYQGVHATGNIIRQQIFMSSSYLLNILLVWLVFYLGCSYETALYVNMGISVVQVCINLYFARINFDYEIRTLLSKVLVPCLLVVGISIVVGYILSSWLDSWIIIGPLITIFSIIIVIGVLGYFFLLDKLERSKMNHMLFSFIRR